MEESAATQADTIKLAHRLPPILGRLRRGRATVAFGLFLLLAFHAVANIAWLRRDNHEVTRDEAIHMELAREYYDAFTSPAHKNLPQRFIATLEIESRYPPLLHALAGGLMVFTGYGVDNMAFLSTLCLLAIILGMYGLARVFFTPSESLYAALVTSFIPLLYAPSRYLAVDYLAAVFVVWGMLCLIRSDALHSTIWATGLAVMLGLGIMARQTTALFFVGPILLVCGWAIVRMWLNAGEWRRIGLNTGIAAVVLFAIVVPWHYAHFDTLYRFWFQEYRDGAGFAPNAPVVPPATPIAGIRPLTAGISPGTVIPFLTMGQAPGVAVTAPAPLLHHPMRDTLQRIVIDQVNATLFLPAALAAVVGAAALLFARRPRLPSLVIILWPITSLLLWYSFLPVAGSRYSIPAVPAFGLWCAASICSLPRGRIRLGAGTAFAFILTLTYANLTFGASTVASKFEIPVPNPPYDIERNQDRGIVIFKDRIIAGNYTFRTPVIGENPTERIFRILAADARNNDAPPDTVLTLQQVGVKSSHGGGYFWHGDFFNPEHFAPLPNPYLSVPEDLSLPRPFRRIGPYQALSTEALLPQLDNTDYVLIRYPAKPEKRFPVGRLDQWGKMLTERHFVPLDEFPCPQWETLPESRYVLLKRFGYPREQIDRWDFSDPAGNRAGWTFPEGATESPDGLRYPVAGRVSGPIFQGTPFSSSTVDTVTLRAGPDIETSSDGIALSWQRVGDATEAGASQTSVPFVYSDRLGAWEASPRRNKNWNGTISGLSINITASPGSLDKLYGFTGTDITSGKIPNVRSWNFAGAESTPWDFRGQTEFTAEGAVRANPKNGWGPRLMEQSFDVGQANILWIALSTSSSRGLPVGIEKMHLYWTRSFDPRSRNPFGHERSVRMYPLGSGTDGSSIWIAGLDTDAAWEGTIRDLFIGMDFSGTARGWFNSTSVTIIGIGLVKAPKRAESTGGVMVTIREIAFNRIAREPVNPASIPEPSN